MWVNAPPRDLQEWYERGHSEETAKALAELGVNIITTRFYKGFGLEAEEEDIESGKRFITHCHKYGIKALVYIQFKTIMQETIRKEIPNARDWANRDPEGRVATWDQGWYWRWITCPTNGDFISYLKKAMQKALTEADADGIWLDNFSWDLNGCYCQRCKETFRRYLKDKYTLEEFKRRVGFSDIDLIEPPPMNKITFRDPISREWMHFRGDYLEAKAKEFRELIASIKPDALFAGHGEMIRRRQSVYSGLFSRRKNRYYDMNVCEHHDFPRVTEEGDMVSMIREYKLGFAENHSIISFAYIPPEERPRYREGGFSAIPRPEEARLSLAEAAAFGGHAAGGLWLTVPFKGKFAFEDPNIYKALKSCYDLMIRHEDCYREIESGANIAVIRSSLSLLYTFNETLPCLRGIEQALIQGHVPFDLISVDDTFGEEISRYDLLILPNFTCLSDGQVDFLKGYVKNGGNIVAIGHTSLYDENYQKRWEYGLSEVFGLSFNQDRRDSGLINRYGKGKCLYFSEEEFLPIEENVSGSTFITPLPKDWKYIVERIKRVTPDLPLELYAPRNVAVELFKQDKKNRLLLHLINYQVDRNFKDIKVELRIPEGKKVSGITCLSPDREGEENISFGNIRNFTTFNAPELDIYNLLVVDYQ